MPVCQMGRGFELTYEEEITTLGPANFMPFYVGLNVVGQQTFCQDGRFVRKTICQDRLRRFVREKFGQDRTRCLVRTDLS